MNHTQPTRARGSVAEILFVLLVVVFFAGLFLRPRRPPSRARKVKQMAQLHSLSCGVELFSDDCGGYPPSDANDASGVPYGGAMKLAEALLGRDLLGYHADSVFRADGRDAAGLVLYPRDPSKESMERRRGPYIQWESANAHRLAEIYGEGNTGPFPGDMLVLCDTCERKRPNGQRIGLPILYYRARTGRGAHDVNDPGNPDNIYDYRDNHALVSLGVPGEADTVHPLGDPRRFYLNTRNWKIVDRSRPHRPDTFILLSAGWDGLCGTADDVFSFEWKHRED
jgi:hypothetical protein